MTPKANEEDNGNEEENGKMKEKSFLTLKKLKKILR